MQDPQEEQKTKKDREEDAPHSSKKPRVVEEPLVDPTTETKKEIVIPFPDYRTHSVASNPGVHSALLDALPSDPAGVSRTVQGLIYHYMAGPFIYGWKPPAERLKESDTRYVERILQRLQELDTRPLSDARDFEQRFIGCCRDFCLLSCAILRQHGHVARLRYGFGNYFVKDYWFDHVVVETWDGERWIRFDPQMPPGSTPFNALDMPEGVFLTGGEALRMVREQKADPARFGIGPNVPQVSGVKFIRGRLMLDTAALIKQEMLCWDSWGIANWEENEALSKEDELLLDQLATATAQPSISPLQSLLAKDPRLPMPGRVLCSSPTQGNQTVEFPIS